MSQSPPVVRSQSIVESNVRSSRPSNSEPRFGTICGSPGAAVEKIRCHSICVAIDGSWCVTLLLKRCEMGSLSEAVEWNASRVITPRRAAYTAPETRRCARALSRRGSIRALRPNEPIHKPIMLSLPTLVFPLERLVAPPPTPTFSPQRSVADRAWRIGVLAPIERSIAAGSPTLNARLQVKIPCR